MESTINSFTWRNNSITVKKIILIDYRTGLTQAKGFHNLNISKNLVCTYT